jgi:hypothetical protein
MSHFQETFEYMREKHWLHQPETTNTSYKFRGFWVSEFQETRKLVKISKNSFCWCTELPFPKIVHSIVPQLVHQHFTALVRPIKTVFSFHLNPSALMHWSSWSRGGWQFVARAQMYMLSRIRCFSRAVRSQFSKRSMGRFDPAKKSDFVRSIDSAHI